MEALQDGVGHEFCQEAGLQREIPPSQRREQAAISHKSSTVACQPIECYDSHKYAFQSPISTFHDVPRPIMSRLPCHEQYPGVDLDGKAYIKPVEGSTIPGGLPYCMLWDGLTYTRSELPELSTFAREVWTALHSFRPLTTEYAGRIGEEAEVHQSTYTMDASRLTPILDLIQNVFNWKSLQLPEYLSGSLHGVAFRSRRAPGSESLSLYHADRLAHEEAVASGGLLMYWYGVPDQSGVNLATCIWTEKTSARIASTLPRHREAVRHAKQAYETFQLVEYRIEKRAGEKVMRIR